MTEEFLRALGAMALVLGLMGGLALLAKHFGWAAPLKATSAQGRLRLIESLSLDPQRRLVLVRCDDHEHVLVLGPQGDMVVEANKPAKEEDKDA